MYGREQETLRLGWQRRCDRTVSEAHTRVRVHVSMRGGQHMRRTHLYVATLALLASAALGCGHTEKTMIRRETVQTVPPPTVVERKRTTVETVPAPPAVVEKRTTVETVPAAPVIERRTTETLHTND